MWEDFVDIIFSPASVFRRRQRGNWFIPLIVVTVAIALIVFATRGVLQPAVDAEVERAADAMRKNPQVTEDMIEKARGYIAWSITVGPIIFRPISIIGRNTTPVPSDDRPRCCCRSRLITNGSP